MKTWVMTITYLPRRNVRWQTHLDDEEFKDFINSVNGFRFFDIFNKNLLTKLKSKVLDECSIVFEKIEGEK